jgi:peroxiredoxin
MLLKGRSSSMGLEFWTHGGATITGRERSSMRAPSYLILAVMVIAGSAGIALRVGQSRSNEVKYDASSTLAEAEKSGASEGRSAPGTAGGRLSLGDNFPDITLADGEGKPVRLHDLRGEDRFLVVLFHSPDCPCSASCGRLVNEMTAAGYDDVTVVGILASGHDDLRVMAALDEQIKDGTVTFPIYIDPEGDARRALGATRTPELWVVDKERRIAFYGAPENTLYPGSTGHRYLLREAIDALRKGERPEIERYDPIGCPID